MSSSEESTFTTVALLFVFGFFLVSGVFSSSSSSRLVSIMKLLLPVTVLLVMTSFLESRKTIHYIVYKLPRR